MNTIASHPDSRLRITLTLITAAWLALAFPACAAGHSAAENLPETTVVLFADHPMTTELWTSLQSSLEVAFLSSSEDDGHDSPSLRILRGDQLPLGLEVQTSISIYLHGDCNLTLSASLRPGRRIVGALGWVIAENGHIQPFIHVDCALIGDLLRSRAAFLNGFENRAQRTHVMTIAITRVLLHEYIHVAKQSSAHSKRGVAKAEFNVNDLIAPTLATVADLHPQADTSTAGSGR